MPFKNKEERLAWQRIYQPKYRATNLRKNYLYTKTISAHRNRMYILMKNRVKGKSCKSPNLYIGLSICTKEEFYNFIDNSIEFKLLYEVWKESDYKITLTPSVNRKNPDRGYTIDNLEIVTFSYNCKMTRKNKCYVTNT